MINVVFMVMKYIKFVFVFLMLGNVIKIMFLMVMIKLLWLLSDAYNIWNLYNATLLRLIHENTEIPLWEKYDNLQDINNNARLRCSLGFGLDFRFGCY